MVINSNCMSLTEIFLVGSDQSWWSGRSMGYQQRLGKNRLLGVSQEGSKLGREIMDQSTTVQSVFVKSFIFFIVNN